MEKVYLFVGGESTKKEEAMNGNINFTKNGEIMLIYLLGKVVDSNYRRKQKSGDI